MSEKEPDLKVYAAMLREIRETFISKVTDEPHKYSITLITLMDSIMMQALEDLEATEETIEESDFPDCPF